MTTRAPEPSAYARDRLDELVDCGCIVEVLAITEQGTLLVLMEGDTPLFITHAEDATRSELGRQVFVVCASAAPSFQRFMRSQVDENFRLQLMH